MEIAGWGAAGVVIQNALPPGWPYSEDRRINDFSHVRIHDNFIHHNQYPSKGGGAVGYGIEISVWGARAHISRNVFDLNRHAIAAAGDSGGYVAEENLVLKGGGYHGPRIGPTNPYTHIFDVHGTGCWWSSDLCGDAGEEFHYDRNSFQYRSGAAIKIRGKPRKFPVGASITNNVFPHDGLEGSFGGEDAIYLDTSEHVQIGPGNITKTDTFGQYGVCDFDGDGIDDLLLATGATWWYSSSGKFHWSFLNTSSKRTKDLRFGYFDDDNRCDVLTESGGSGRWLISSGGTGAWKLLELLHGGIERGFKAPLTEVVFGRFNPRDHRHSRQTTHAFWRKANGEWHVTPLSSPEGWEYIGGSHKPMSELRFGDFTGDGVTDVLAVNNGRWAISESARTRWQPLNRYNDPVAGLFIANMDSDDEKDDILRLEVRSKALTNGQEDIDLIWSRSKNGIDKWREFKRHTFRYPGVQPGQPGIVYPKLGFVGRFGAASLGATLVIDTNRVGRFFSAAERNVRHASDWTSHSPY